MHAVSSAPSHLCLHVHGWRRLGGLPRVANAELSGPYGFLRTVQVALLSPSGAAAGARAERVAAVRAASSLQHAGLQPVHDVLATVDGDLVVAGALEGHDLETLLAGAAIPRPAAYAIAMDLADAAQYLAEASAPMVAVTPADVLIAPDGRVRILHPVLLHAVAGRPLATPEEVGGSIVEVLRRLLFASGVAAPERALHAVLGRRPTPARLHEQLATHLFARRYAYERRGVASIVREHRARSGVHRAEPTAPELLLAWSA